VRFSFDTEASPELATMAFTDFSERRLEIWRRTLDPGRYEVRERGETWAVAKEGSAGSPFWVVTRYDWADPRAIGWDVVESNFGGNGPGSIRIAAGSEGGSRVDVEYRESGVRPVLRPVIMLVHNPAMDRVVARLWASALDRLARSEAG